MKGDAGGGGGSSWHTQGPLPVGKEGCVVNMHGERSVANMHGKGVWLTCNGVWLTCMHNMNVSSPSWSWTDPT